MRARGLHELLIRENSENLVKIRVVAEKFRSISGEIEEEVGGVGFFEL